MEAGEVGAMKADLHVHTKHSKRPSEWILQKIGAAESYTEPRKVYDLCKRRGMNVFTITDHNVIDGALEIAHLDNTFISEEITTYYPDNGCKLHVLAWDISEGQHHEIQRLRRNVYDLVAYLQAEDIIHSLAHPMYDMNSRLTPEHFEKSLLLFKHMELNGSRDDYQNGILRTIVESLTEDDIHMLADKHGFAPKVSEAWIKHLTAGSDDHSSLNVARSHTEVPANGSDNVKIFLEGLRRGRAVPVSRPATPRSMAHNLYSIAYQFYKDKFGLEKFVGRDLLLRFVDRALTNEDIPEKGLKAKLHELISHIRANSAEKSMPKTVQGWFHKEALTIVRNDKEMMNSFKRNENLPWESESDWFSFVDSASEKVLKHFADSILNSFKGADVFSVFSAVGSAGSSYIMLAPYVVGYTYFSKDRNFCRTCEERFSKAPKPQSGKRRIAHFTDTFGHANVVADTLKMQVDTAMKNKKRLTMITCGPRGHDGPGVKNFEPIGSFSMDKGKGMPLYYPPLLKILDYVYELDVTHIHAATPGPMGLAALAVSRMLKLPLKASHNAAFPHFAGKFTQDAAMEGLAWKYITWFYNQADTVYVPSRMFAEELVEQGVNEEKIKHSPLGVDLELFSPEKRNGFYPDRFPGQVQHADEELRILYVGRLSEEKNIDAVAKVLNSLHKEIPGARLVVVGDGPSMKDMKKALKGTDVLFTGFLEGEELAQAYASADVFVMPVTTGTFGNVVMEAQASGLPVVVGDAGAPKENVQQGATGFVVPESDPEAFVSAVKPLAASKDTLAAMKAEARKHMEKHCFERTYLKHWNSYGLENTSETTAEGM